MAPRRVALIFALAALGFLAVLAAAALPALGAPEPCTVSIAIANPSKEAAVTSTQPMAVQFTGNYTVTKPPLVERASLTLTASVDTGWVATVSPASITLTNQVSGQFTITSVVPAGTLASQIGSGLLTARLVAAGLQCQDEEGFTITPLPYLERVTARAEPANVTVKGGTGSFSLLLDATANTPVTLALEYVSVQGLTVSGPDTVTLTADENGLDNASVKIQLRSQDLLPGAYAVRVHVRATTAGGLAAETDGVANATIPMAPGLLSSGESVVPLVVVGAVGVAAVLWWRHRR